MVYISALWVYKLNEVEPLFNEPYIGAFKNLLSEIKEKIPEAFPEKTTDLQFVVEGLHKKIVSNCKAVLGLVLDGYNAEAILISRSAYEATLIMHYLIQNDSEVKDYQKFSDLVEFKNRFRAFQKGDYHAYQVPAKYFAEHKKLLIQNGLLNKKFFNARQKEKQDLDKILKDQSILGDYSKFEKYLIKTFKPVSRMQTAIQRSDHPIHKNLVIMSELLWDQASQHIHAHWHTIVEYYYENDVEGNPIRQIVREPLIISGMLLLLNLSVHGLYKAKLIGEFHELTAPFQYAVNTVLDKVKSERIIISDIIEPIYGSTPKGRKLITELSETKF